MENIHQRLAALGAGIPALLLPRPGLDLSKWAVIACDQFTQDGQYWDRARQIAGTGPSALHLIFPEIYLGGGDREERTGNIHRTMEAYLRGGIFAPPRRGCIYVERRTPFHPLRRGLICAVDLEQYDWAPHARPLIRSTEGTVPERLPPRMEIRRGAPLEIPHIILLIDDEEDRLLPGLAARAKGVPPLYDTSLMMDAGGVTGWLLDREDDWEYLAGGLETLARQAETRYGQRDDTPFLYAVGDGNHSLAAAKAVWEEYRASHGDSETADHPARWALVEIENLYDPGIDFEPIHRVLFGPPAEEVRKALSALPGFTCRPAGDRAELSRFVGDPAAPRARLGLIAGAQLSLIESAAPGLITDSLQPLLDRFTAAHAGGIPYRIDYIHGEDELFRIAGTPGQAAVGLLLPPIKKSGLFQTVARRGPLPRKSFSMGEAPEKRFYLESRRLFG
jgi:hypothetical protein